MKKLRWATEYTMAFVLEFESEGAECTITFVNDGHGCMIILRRNDEDVITLVSPCCPSSLVEAHALLADVADECGLSIPGPEDAEFEKPQDC